MPLAKKTTAAVAAVVAAAVADINFGDRGMYGGADRLPNGDYILFFDTKMHSGEDKSGKPYGPPRLGVMVTAHNRADLTVPAKQQFYSMGSNAHLSFAPNPDTGKGLVAVPNGPSAKLNNSTNWSMFLDSLYDSGLPEGIFINDLSVLDGIWVHIENVPEPAGRSGFQSNTSEVEPQQNKRPGTVAVVTVIEDEGKPWENTGGLPAAGAAPAAAKPAAKALAKPVAKVAAKAAAPVAEAAVAELSEDDMVEAAQAAIGDHLEKNPEGGTKVIFRMAAFKSLTKSLGSAVEATQVVDLCFADDETLSQVIEPLGYKCVGGVVSVA